MGLEVLVAYIQNAQFGGNMKKQTNAQVNKLHQLTIIFCLLLIVGCKNNTPPLYGISTPGLINPVSMSPRVGVNPHQKFEKVKDFLVIAQKNQWDENQRPTQVQSQMSQAVMGSERKAIKDLYITIILGGGVLGHLGDKMRSVAVQGAVIETY